MVNYSLVNFYWFILCQQAPKEELLQTCIAKSLMWAEKEPSVDCDEAFVPSLAERISFAALQPVTGKCVCDPFLFSIAIEIHLSSMSSHIFVRSLKMILLLTALTKAFSSFFCLQFKPNNVSGALYWNQVRKQGDGPFCIRRVEFLWCQKYGIEKERKYKTYSYMGNNLNYWWIHKRMHHAYQTTPNQNLHA